MPPDQHSFGVLTQQQLDEAWPQVLQLLSKADPFSPDQTTSDEIIELARQGRAHVFVLVTERGMEAAMAMTFATGKAGKAMNIAIFGGKHTELIFDHYGAKVEQFARECGASRITAWCRPSAARLFNRITGTHTDYHRIAKELT